MQANREPLPDFECFVQARAAGLFRTALALSCQDRAEAEDLLQVCLERAYRHWHRIASQGVDPERYARRILVNAALDRRRWLRRRPEWPLSAAGAVDAGRLAQRPPADRVGTLSPAISTDMACPASTSESALPAHIHDCEKIRCSSIVSMASEVQY